MKRARTVLSRVLVFSGVGLLGGLLEAPAAFATTNLLDNPAFNRDLAGWTVPFPSSTDATYAAGIDRQQAADSGAARVTAIDPGLFTVTVLQSECFPVTAGEFVRWRAWSRIPGGQASTGGVQPGLKFSTDPNCATLLPPTFFIDHSFNQGNPIGKWIQLSAEGEVPAGVVAARLQLSPFKDSGSGPFSVLFDDIEFVQLGCDGKSSDTMLCLQNGRFTVSAEWFTSTGSDFAGAVQLTDDTGYFWFFDPANVEVTVKVLNACALFDRFWSFSAGLTNVAVVITVEDTEKGGTQVYSNPSGTTYEAVLDTDAFATCP